MSAEERERMKGAISAVEDLWEHDGPDEYTIGPEMAERVIKALEAAGYVICRMDGGVHTGTCPMCGCEPLSAERMGRVPPAPA